MEKRFLVLMILVSMSFISCEMTPAETTVEIYISEQPFDGYNQQEVSATFVADLYFIPATYLFKDDESTPDEIAITCEWYWDNYFHFDETHLKTEKYYISEDASESFTTSFNAGEGMVLNNHFWVVISWTDNDGDSQTISEKAYFDS